LEFDKADIKWERMGYWFSSHVGSSVVTDVLPEKWG